MENNNFNEMNNEQNMYVPQGTEFPENKAQSSGRNKMMVIIGSILGVIGCFLPFATVSLLGFSQSITFMEGDGIIVLILSIVAIVLAVLKLERFSFIPSGIALLVTLYDSMNMASVASESYGVASMAIGAYVVILAIAVAVVGSILALLKK